MLHALRLQNLDSVAHVYGEDAAQAACKDIGNFLAQTIADAGSSHRITRREIGRYEIQSRRPRSPEDSQTLKSDLFRAWKSIATTVRSYGPSKFLLIPAISEVPLETSNWPLTIPMALCRDRIAEAAGHSLSNYSTADAFERDMNAAVGWVEDLCSDRLVMSWDQVRSLSYDRDPEYLIGRLASQGPDGCPVSLRSAEIAMRRLGIGSILDYEIIARCLACLSTEISSAVAIEISEESVTTHAGILAHLLDEFDDIVTARMRLIIREEGKYHPDRYKKAINLLRKRKVAIGTKIGTNYGAAVFPPFETQPDLIVIPAAYLRSTIARPENIVALSTIATLAKSVCPKVIVQGVDCALLAKHARDAGLEWGQGHYLGRTSWTRTRRVAALSCQPAHSIGPT